jgi:enterochelin esterase family protein
VSRLLLSFAFLISLTAGVDAATAQIANAGAARPVPPTREPSTPGYVKPKELPDGAIPSPKEDGNFIIGPTHNAAPEMAGNEEIPKGDVFEFTM